MRKRPNQQQKFYFSAKLKKHLDQISLYPLTLVEAPSGFGKTTAIREYLKENLAHGAREYWYTCLGESAPMAWMGFCDLLSNVNGKVAADLQNLQMPTLDTLFYLRSYLKTIPCRSETYFVVDNYQLINWAISRELISVFSMHGNPNLHIIVITQQGKFKQQFSFYNNNIYTLGSAAFLFDLESTASLFRLEGVRLTDDEAQDVYRGTGGWVSAIRLQIINYKARGFFAYTADIEHLVETAIWNRLTGEEKDFLLAVSVIDSFSELQAAIMMGRERLPETIRDLLKSNEFIRYIPDQRLYTIHSILRNYLLQRFYYDQPKEYQNLVFRRAGHACAAIAQYCSAAKLFYTVGDFDAILSLPFTRDYLENQKDKPEFIIALVNECQEETLGKYPFTLLVFGYMTFMCGQLEAYQKICRILSLIVQRNPSDFSREEIRKINGEYVLLTSLGEFNNIAKMREGQKKAWEILGKPTDMLKTNTPWLFTAPSVLDMLWRESGELEHILRQIDEGRNLYLNLAQGHGAGAGHILRAETMLMRGEDDAAEIWCHKALYDARNYRRVGMCLCVEVVFARIAILRGDAAGYFKALKNIQGYVKNSTSLSVLRMTEHCLSVLGLLLGNKDDVAPWLYDIESIKKVLYAPVFPFAQVLHLKLLLMEKRYNEFYGICQLALETGGKPRGNIKYMMPQVYHLIYLALAERNHGNHLEARKHLREALDIALPDQIYLPFAQEECMADFLSELNICSLASPAVPVAGAIKPARTSESGSFAALIPLCRRQMKGVGIIKKAILQHKSPLTPREREIAQLAKEKLSAKEIAHKLYISEATVKTVLRNVYSKLDIHSKNELALREF